MKNENIWLEVRFDGIAFDNVIANSREEAEELIKSIEKYGFEEYNSIVKEEWLSEGFRDNPEVTVVYCD